MKHLLSFIVLLFLMPAFSQDIKISKGDFEANVSSILSRGEIDLETRFGAFIADYLQVGLDVGYTDTDFLSRLDLGVYGTRFFETRTYAIPYAGLGMGYSTLDGGGEGDFSGVSFSLLLGVRYYLAENVALNTEVRSAWATDKTFIDSDRAVDTEFSLRVGLSYLW